MNDKRNLRVLCTPNSKQSRNFAFGRYSAGCELSFGTQTFYHVEWVKSEKDRQLKSSAIPSRLHSIIVLVIHDLLHVHIIFYLKTWITVAVRSRRMLSSLVHQTILNRYPNDSPWNELILWLITICLFLIWSAYTSYTAASVGRGDFDGRISSHAKTCQPLVTPQLTILGFILL